MPIDPNNDPNEAYEVVPMKQEPHGLPADWWTVKCNGIAVRHYGPLGKGDAERYCNDPAYRLSLIVKKLWDRS